MSPLARRHLKIGWLAIAVFSMMGIALEAAHGFKLGLYLDVGNETRRLMWTLAHAHGTLLGLAQMRSRRGAGILPQPPKKRYTVPVSYIPPSLV